MDQSFVTTLVLALLMEAERLGGKNAEVRVRVTLGLHLQFRVERDGMVFQIGETLPLVALRNAVDPDHVVQLVVQRFTKDIRRAFTSVPQSPAPAPSVGR